MSKPILVGHDPAGSDPAPVRFGVAAARFTGAPLIVGSAHADHAAIGHGHHSADTGLADDATEQLDRIRAGLEADDVRAEYRALPGMSAPRALHAAAEELDAGLLVVGHGAGHHHLHGSTAERLLHGAPCPIAVVPSGWMPKGGVGIVGVAFTDTPEGQEALRGAVALARRAGAKLRVLSAAKPHGFHETSAGTPAVQGMTYGEIGGELRVAAERAVAEATAGVEGLDVEPDVSVQDPADFLIAASERLDLLVCGSRGYGPQRAVLLGGVSRRVTAEAACPVIVLERGAEASLESLIVEPATVAS